MVSYSNYKRHLKNAHPSLSHDIDETLEGDASISGGVSPPGGTGIAGNGNDALHPIKYLGHQMDEDEEDLGSDFVFSIFSQSSQIISHRRD